MVVTVRPMTDIVATTSRGQMFRTRVAEIRRPAIDADRLTALKRLTSELRPGTPATELQRQLDAIESRPRRYPEIVRVLGAGLGMVMQNLTLIVQNDTPPTQLGAASSNVKTALVMSLEPPTSDMSITFWPCGPTRSTSRSSG